MIRRLIAVYTLGLGLGAAYAQSPPLVPPAPAGATVVFAGNAAFSAVIPFIQALPLPSCDGTSWSNMVGGMRNGLVRVGTSDWYQNSGACGLKLFVYNHEGALTKFAAFVLRDGVTKFSDMPYVQGESWSGFADAEFTDTIFSYSTENLGALTTTSELVPALLRTKFAAGASYAGMTQLPVPQGAQLFTKAKLAGELGNLLNGPINLPTNNLWLRSEFRTKKNEILLPPEQTFSGPLGMTPITLSAVTISIDADRNIAFMGNATFASMPGKVLPMVIDSPALVPKTWPRNWPASQIALNAPRVLGLNDYVNLMTDLATQGPQAASRVPFISDIVPAPALLDKLKKLSKPLGTIRMINPDPNADSFRLAAGTGYPNLAQFNFVLLGSQARTKDGTNAQGPLLRFNAEMDVFGQRLARSNTEISKTVFKTTSSGGFNIGLESVGITSPSVDAVVDIATTPIKADIALKVKSTVRNLDFIFNETTIAANSPANCALPVTLKASMTIDGATTPKSLVDSLKPSMPDAQLALNCTTAVYYLVSDGVVYVFSGTTQLFSMAANAFPAADISKMGTDGSKLVGGAVVAAGKEAIEAGKKIGGALGAAATKIGGTAVAVILNPLDALNKVGKLFSAGAWTHHPNRPTYDCRSFDPNTGPAAVKFIEAYPPGRMWGSRSDYDNRGMNFARFVYSQASGKFHPIMETALGATACGGLVGEEGVGYGRINTADKEIWGKAVMCEREQFPLHLVGAVLNTPSECYAARGLSVPATAIKNQLVRWNNDGVMATYLIDGNGAMHLVGWKDDWSVFNACGLNGTDFKLNLLGLHDMYKIPRGADFRTGAECLALLAANPSPRPSLANTLVNSATGVFHIDAHGYKHLIGSPDTLSTCYPGQAPRARGDTAGIADGASYATADSCLATIPNRRMESRGKLLETRDKPGTPSLINRFGFRVPLAINALQILSCGFPLNHVGAQYTLWLNTTAEVNAVPSGGGAITTVADCKAIRAYALQ